MLDSIIGMFGAGVDLTALLWAVSAYWSVWGVLLGVTGTLALQARRARRRGKTG